MNQQGIKGEKVSVILPTYNEKENIPSLIDAIHNELANYNHEILVVDDNSPDGTYQAVLNLNYPYVQAILRVKNRGLANSIRCGLENAKGSIFIIMDSDFNHRPEDIPFMVEALSHFDCVVGSRFLYGGRGVGPGRHLLSWSFNIFLRLVTDGRITDSLYGFLAIHREVIEQLNYDDIFWGFGDYCIRLMYYSQRQGMTILQVPMITSERLSGRENRQFVRVFIQYTIAAGVIE
ncbi:Undecaprenyl-phosphate mannosyltransferase [subsurface metagenome]